MSFTVHCCKGLSVQYSWAKIEYNALISFFLQFRYVSMAFEMPKFAISLYYKQKQTKKNTCTIIGQINYFIPLRKISQDSSMLQNRTSLYYFLRGILFSFLFLSSRIGHLPLYYTSWQKATHYSITIYQHTVYIQLQPPPQND